MFCHHFCGIPIESDIPLALPAGAAEARPRCAVSSQQVSRRFTDRTDWILDSQFSPGRTWLQLSAEAGRYRIRFPGFADFLVPGDCSRIHYHPEGSTPPLTIAHLLTSQVIPMVLAQQGFHLVHGSAVGTPGGVVAFLGATGAGKSTVAAYLAMQGLPIVAEDVLRLRPDQERLLACPGFPDIRIWPDAVPELFGSIVPSLSPVAHFTRKCRLGVEELGDAKHADEEAPIRAVYVLRPGTPACEGEPIRVTRLSIREAFAEAANAVFRLDVRDRVRSRREFEFLTNLIEKVPFYSLEYQLRFENLNRIRENIQAAPPAACFEAV